MTVKLQQKRHSGYTALIIIDVDYFRSINERHGYPGGDKVLVALSLLPAQASAAIRYHRAVMGATNSALSPKGLMRQKH